MAVICVQVVLFLQYTYVIGTNGLSFNHNEDTTSSYQCIPDKCIPQHIKLEAQCSYVKECCKDTLGDTLINYLTMQYCTFDVLQLIGALFITILFLYALWVISFLADDYFAPTMEEMARVLGISEELAGVTIVAFGNGAPDISTSVVAILQGGPTTKLALGTLLGSALFVPIVVSAVITFAVKEPTVRPTPLLRDCFFLVVAAACILFITRDQKVSLAEAMGMVLIYVVYVLSVVSGEVYKKWRTRLKTIQNMEPSRQYTYDRSLTDRIMPLVGVVAFEAPITHLFTPKNGPLGTSMPTIQSQREIVYIQPLAPTYDTKASERDIPTPTPRERCGSVSLTVRSFLREQQQDDHRTVAQKWLFRILRGPTIWIELLCKISIPFANDNWNDWIAVVSCVTAPIFIQWAFFPSSITQLINNKIPVVGIVAIGGIGMALITAVKIKGKYDIIEKENPLLMDDESIEMSARVMLSHNKKKDLSTQPVMKRFFLLLGFFSAIAWFQVVAGELVNLLTTLGVISGVDLTLLGLTIFAWGISITDLIADVSVSKRGYSKMGIAAAIGGATFNLLIGVGLGTTIKTLSTPDEIDILPNTVHIFVSCIAVMVGITIYAIWIAFDHWTLKKPFGYFCFVYYAGFMVLILAIYKTM